VAIVFAAGLVATLSLSPLLARFGAISDDLRFQLTPTVVRAGLSYAPFGTGLGSFEAVYPTLERPESITHAYVNHAHNDFAEIWLETGFVGVGLFSLFVTWWFTATIHAARDSDPSYSSQALAGATVVVLLLACSAVDYPLRTPALATLFAFCCGLMVPPRNYRIDSDRSRSATSQTAE
jgi:O-antigen ligase